MQGWFNTWNTFNTAIKHNNKKKVKNKTKQLHGGGGALQNPKSNMIRLTQLKLGSE